MYLSKEKLAMSKFQFISLKEITVSLKGTKDILDICFKVNYLYLARK